MTFASANQKPYYDSAIRERLGRTVGRYESPSCSQLTSYGVASGVNDPEEHLELAGVEVLQFELVRVLLALGERKHVAEDGRHHSEVLNRI